MKKLLAAVIAVVFGCCQPATAQYIGPTGGSSINLSSVNPWTGQQYFAVQALAFVSGGTAWNLNTQCDATLAPSASFTLNNPTNIAAGSTCTVTITQDATGGRVITYGTAYKFPGGAKFVLSTAANAVDVLSCHSPDGTNMDCVGQPAFQ
jgi:hypothetical protein